MEEAKTVESTFERETQTVVNAQEALTEALMTGQSGLFTLTEGATTALRAEVGGLDSEGKALLESAEKLTPIQETRQRVLAREADDALSRGDEEAAARLRQGAENLKNSLQEVRDRASACRDRKAEVEREIAQAGAKVYAEM